MNTKYNSSVFSVLGVVSLIQSNSVSQADRRVADGRMYTEIIIKIGMDQLMDGIMHR